MSPFSWAIPRQFWATICQEQVCTRQPGRRIPVSTGQRSVARTGSAGKGRSLPACIGGEQEASLRCVPRYAAAGRLSHAGASGTTVEDIVGNTMDRMQKAEAYRKELGKTGPRHWPGRIPNWRLSGSAWNMARSPDRAAWMRVIAASSPWSSWPPSRRRRG